jgi:hypothetical protein
VAETNRSAGRYAVFTSITMSYLPNARIMARSVKKHHPDWHVVLLLNDRAPAGFRWEQEPFDQVVLAEWLPVSKPWAEWAYGYSVVEFCTATKGVMSEYLFDALGFDYVIYLDPDTMVFSPLVEIEELLSASADVVLTPHLTDPESSAKAIWSHEMAALKHGTFNLGFFAIANRPDGRRYLTWWADRLLDYSQIDFNQGLFTDQKWANLAPYMFDGIFVLKDRAYNVATWNMLARTISLHSASGWLVNGKPLRFYHFSGFGRDFEWADLELEAFGAGSQAVKDLWDLYKSEYAANSIMPELRDWVWGRDNFGRKITPEMRREAAERRPLDPYDDWRT